MSAGERLLRESLTAVGAEVEDSQIEYMSAMVTDLVAGKHWDIEEWVETLSPILEDWLDEAAIRSVCTGVIKASGGKVVGSNESSAETAEVVPVEEEERRYDASDGGRYTRAEFIGEYGSPAEWDAAASIGGVGGVGGAMVSLSGLNLGFMGGRLLLNEASLRLERGHRYGLCGANGCGKSTLMSRIAAKDMPGFPKALRVTYVKHEISGDDVTLSVGEFLLAAATRLKSTKNEEEVRGILTAMGFDTDKQAQGVQELSGGWRMRLALAQAMLSEMDVLCLDEPTNHLDTKSVNWLQAYLADLGHVTLVVVSHEPSFLDAVVTDMLHICEQELTAHPGTFTEFLTNTGATLESLHITEVSAELHFPEPEKLMNVAPTQAVLKLANVDFAYTKGGPTVLHDITCKLMLISRCAVIGDNGAGKSTLIKLLVGEHLASKGMCWRHHNMRVAYVAQHTFFHLEDHLQDTAIHYLQHRFQAGNDSESPVVKAGSAMAKEVVSGEKPLGRDEWGKIAEFRLDSLVGRRKYKKEVEYEVHYKDRKDKTNKWVPQSELRSWGKHANQLMADFDEEMRMREAGVDSRAINPTEVEAHFESFGLKASISNSKIEELSGGQRARLVLAAAMWNKPHLIVLDEPTNFLDEEALKALGNAIGEFKGAVIMVSHHEDFVTRLCSEVWRVTDGRLVVEQKTYDSKTAAYSNVTPER